MRALYWMHGETHAQASDQKTDRYQIRIPPAQKAQAAEVDKVSKRDFVRILDLLEHPPGPNPKLRAAISALPDTF